MLRNYLNLIRFHQSIFFIILTLIGIVISDVYEIYQIIIKIILIFFLWQYTIAVNRIYDDKLKDNVYFSITLSFLIISLIVSFMLGYVFLIISIIYIIAGTAYSVPPLRLRKYFLSTIFIGIGSVLAFLIGYYQDVSSPFTYDIMIYCVLIFLATTLGSTIKDMKDYEKDKKAGIKNIFTVFGIEKGKRISYTLLFITFIIPSLLFSLPLDILFFILMAFLAIVIFMKLEDFRPVMLMAFIVLLYCILRLKGIL